MTVATYTLSIDWGTGWQDVTSDWISSNIMRGFSNPLARVATVGRATFELENADKSYSPPLHAGVRPGSEVRFQMTYGATTTTLFRGFIESIAPQAGQFREKKAVIHCVDAMRLLDIFEGPIALQTNTFADDVISEVVSAVYTPPATNYQPGLNPFPTSADRWIYESGFTAAEAGFGIRPREQVRASQKIQNTCTSDWGRFFIAGDGTATYYNRHQTTLDTTIALTLDDTMLDMHYEMPAGDIYNYVEVACLPRAIGGIYEVLGRLSQKDAPMIEASDSRTFVLRFRDPSNTAQAVGGYSCLTPVASTDYVVTDDEGGEGNDVTASVTPSATFYGDYAEITLSNTTAAPAYVQKLQVRGIAVRVREPATMIEQDATSIADYGKRTLGINAALMSRQVDAVAMAEYLLDRYKDAQHALDNITIDPNKDATFIAAARDLELLDQVRISETQTGNSSFDGFIYSMQHTVLNDDAHYRDHTLTFSIHGAYTYAGDAWIWDTSTWDGGDVWIY